MLKINSVKCRAEDYKQHPHMYSSPTDVPSSYDVQRRWHHLQSNVAGVSKQKCVEGQGEF